MEMIFLILLLPFMALWVWWRFFIRTMTFRATYYTMDTASPRVLTSGSRFIRFLGYIALIAFGCYVAMRLGQSMHLIEDGHAAGLGRERPIKTIGTFIIGVFYAAYFFLDKK